MFRNGGRKYFWLCRRSRNETKCTFDHDVYWFRIWRNCAYFQKKSATTKTLGVSSIKVTYDPGSSSECTLTFIPKTGTIVNPGDEITLTATPSNANISWATSEGDSGTGATVTVPSSITANSFTINATATANDYSDATASATYVVNQGNSNTYTLATSIEAGVDYVMVGNNGTNDFLATAFNSSGYLDTSEANEGVSFSADRSTLIVTDPTFATFQFESVGNGKWYVKFGDTYLQ